MVDDDKRKPLPINYRRAVNSPIWPMLAFLCLKAGKSPNELLDSLIIEAYSKKKGKK